MSDPTDLERTPQLPPAPSRRPGFLCLPPVMQAPVRALLGWIVLTALLTVPGVAQPRLASEQIKSAYLIRFAENISWPNEDKVREFRIGVFREDTAMAIALTRAVSDAAIRGKSIRVVPLRTLRDVRSVEMAYLGEERSRDLVSWMNAVNGTNVLLVSSDGRPQNQIMVNFIFSPESRTISFETNPQNLGRQGLRIGSALLPLGGAREEARDVTRQSGDTVRIEREQTERQRQQLAEQAKALKALQVENARQREVNARLGREITAQHRELDSAKSALEHMQSSMRSYDDVLARQGAEKKSQDSLLRAQEAEIDGHWRQIEEQKQMMAGQVSIIERQKETLTITILSLVFVALLAIILFRSYRLIRNINAELQTKNELIGSQKVELERQAKLLQAANKELESFSYSVSHDLRAPLRSIHGFSQALTDDYTGVLDDQGKDYLKRVQASTEKMSALIDDLLKLSHVGRQAVQRTRTDLAPIARSILDDLCRSEPGRVVELHIADQVPADADPRLMTIVLQNLLSNAWKFTSQTAKARIEFGVEQQNGRAVYVVRDNGAGFSMTDRERLFAPFQRLHKDEEFSGTGIGLSIVKRIIHRHGGTVWAEGTPGTGAAITFTLPTSTEPSRG